ncbi:MAG TPA: hypothetical protein VJ063_06980 [Verrucomicrobiae bacterium]|nr:hypothetical protein [Verrucomicrobiae bacterium]
MTHTATPEFVQSLIVLSNSRKELLATAMDNARKALEMTAQTAWQPYVETAAEKRANARDRRIALLLESL